MSLLRPLLLDVVPTIQQTAALALGRLANYNDDLAEAVVKGDILPQLVYSLAEQNVRLFQKLFLSEILQIDAFGTIVNWKALESQNASRTLNPYMYMRISLGNFALGLKGIF